MKRIERLAMAAGTVALVASAPAENLPTPKALKAGEVAPATTPQGQQLETLVQDRGADGYSQFAVLNEGQSTARFDVDVPAGSRLEAVPSGEVFIIDDRNPENVVVRGWAEAPWALDAKGTSLATSYRVVDSTTVEQLVDTARAAFPVVADPRWSLGWYYIGPVAYAK